MDQGYLIQEKLRPVCERWLIVGQTTDMFSVMGELLSSDGWFLYVSCAMRKEPDTAMVIGCVQQPVWHVEGSASDEQLV